ncbi:hypothetical protein G9P44_002539 [Scheffersomyces stipitis]|nr:hypothetical protein G9P44_002539 [Scheffersomyces stipitis]
MLFARQAITYSARSYSTAAAAAPRKVGAFRGGFVGFLLGVTVTGAGSYYYLLDQYRLANTVVVADVVALQNSVSNLEKHVKSLEAGK